VACSRRRTFAIDTQSARQLWERPGGRGVAIKGTRVFHLTATEAVCLELATGRELWRTPLLTAEPATGGGKPKPRRRRAARSRGLEGPIRVGAGVVLCAASGKLVALSANDGKVLWTRPGRFSGLRYMFFAGGLLWTRGRGALKESGTVGLDPMTGQVKKQLPDQRVWNAGHHVRCYPPKATDRFILYNMRGAEFLDLASGEVSHHNWVRAICGQGFMPANGLLYSGPHACRCYSENVLRGFYALAPRASRPQSDERSPGAPTLEKGPAYGESPRPAGAAARAGDWPTYRGNAERSGATDVAVPVALKPAWRAELGGKLSSPVIAGGKVFVAAVDTHAVAALSADTGRVLWRFTTGSRIDSPPTIHKGLALFGSADGWVYCLRAEDGRLAWRFHAAPRRRWVGAFGQLESAWPVHGNVLVKGDVAYFAAGRSSFLDGGIHLFGLDVRSGEVVCRSRLDGPWPGPEVGANRTTNQNPG